MFFSLWILWEFYDVAVKHFHKIPSSNHILFDHPPLSQHWHHHVSYFPRPVGGTSWWRHTCTFPNPRDFCGHFFSDADVDVDVVQFWWNFWNLWWSEKFGQFEVCGCCCICSVNVVCQHCHIPHHAMHSYSQHSSRTRQVNWPFVNGQVPRQ